MSSNEQQVAEEAFEQGFHGIPSPQERASMSPEKLAILLSQQTAGSPAHILVEHELNLRIAGIQSQATLRSGWLGLFGALLGAALGFFLGTLSPKENQAIAAPACRCESRQKSNALVDAPPSKSNVQLKQSGVPAKP
ncbi:MAG: hypothetical protein ACHP7O_09720 [Burkholderiales bacterium]